jgi:uncharacterized membrane-anchored protein
MAVMLVATTALAGSDQPKSAKGGNAHEAKPAKGAKPAPAPAPTEAAETGSAADAAAEDPLEARPHITGPKLVDLGHQAEVMVPEGMRLFEEVVARDLVQLGGGNPQGVVAVIAPPTGSPATWAIIIGADDAGYVTDKDADQLDAGAMLADFKVGTEEQNKTRVAKGIPALIIDGWSEPPRYDVAQHHLVWGLNAHDTDGKVINFFTRILGRAGYLSVNLIDDPATIEQSKKQAMSILTATHFKTGARYEDHASGDKDSGIGLKALVLGGAGVLVAKKTGLLVLLVVFLKKGFIIVIAAIGGFFRWLFGKKKKDDAMASFVAPTSPPPPSPAPPAAANDPYAPIAGTPPPGGPPDDPAT